MFCKAAAAVVVVVVVVVAVVLQHLLLLLPVLIVSKLFNCSFSLSLSLLNESSSLFLVHCSMINIFFYRLSLSLSLSRLLAV